MEEFSRGRGCGSGFGQQWLTAQAGGGFTKTGVGGVYGESLGIFYELR